MADNNVNYEQIQRPYDYYLNRSVNNPYSSASQSVPYVNNTGTMTSSQYDDTGGYMNNYSSSLGNTENQPVKADGSLHNVFIDTFIASTNWKPKSVGFYIDGQTGYAEFANVFISGDIHASTGEIGGFVIGFDFIEDTADSFGLSSTVTGGNDVRFWAGSTFTNRNTAPFRVYEDGTAHIGGFKIGLDNFISDLGNVELNQANDTISAGNLTGPGRRVVLDGASGGIFFYNNTDPTNPVGHVFGGEPVGSGGGPSGIHDDLMIVNPNVGVNLGDITIWPGGIRTFGFSSDGFGDAAMLKAGSVLFPSLPVVSGVGVTSDLGSNFSYDTTWNFIYVKHIGDAIAPVVDMTIGTIFATQVQATTVLASAGVESPAFVGPGVTKANFLGTVTACPLPTFDDALEVIRKVPDPVRISDSRGHFGDRMYIDDLTFPDEARYTIEGKREIELTNMVGLLMQAVRQLTDKVDKLEANAGKEGYPTTE